MLPRSKEFKVAITVGHPHNLKEVIMTKSISFHVSRDYIRKFSFADENGRKFIIHHVYPRLDHFCGGAIPDAVNPRTHGKECLKGKLPKCIQETIVEYPHDFVLANRGSTILASTTHYDEDREMLTLYFENYEGPDAIHGMPDGATTYAVILKAQDEVIKSAIEEIGDQNIKSIGDLSSDVIPDYLKNARIHLEIITGITDRETIADLSEGRNTSRQVQAVSMANFNNCYNWLKDILNKQPYGNEIGYEENAEKDTDIREIIAIINLFHEGYTNPENPDNPEKCPQPTQSYSAKGKMIDRITEEEIIIGFKKLSPIIPEILELHDLVYATLPEVYNKSGGKLGLFGEHGDPIFKKHSPPVKLYFSDCKAGYRIPSGVLYPLLASMRALVKYQNEKAVWQMPPKVFWARYSKSLVNLLFERFVDYNRNPNVCGKSKTTYSQLFMAAENQLLRA